MCRLDVLRAQPELRGLVVADAYRSTGSMIHFQFGELHGVTHRRKARTYTDGFGDYGLMIEIAAWS